MKIWNPLKLLLSNSGKLIVFVGFITVFIVGCSVVNPEYKVVSPLVAFEIIRDGGEQVKIIDLRDAAKFRKGRIYNALNIPLESLVSEKVNLGYIKGHTLLVYCDNEDCTRKGAEILVSLGFSHVIVIEGGVKSWTDEGLGLVR